jgi:hypothetical protein
VKRRISLRLHHPTKNKNQKTPNQDEYSIVGLQIALAWLCIAGGIFQIFKIEQLQKKAAAMRALPRGLWAFLGAFGCLAGLGLILPGAIHVLPVLTAYAAAAVTVNRP